eukprot:scaffold58075_cov96-Phaeocystis_antarctica.AAC.1
MGFGPIELFDFLYSQLQTSSPYNQKSGKPRFGGDGLKMAKCLLRDGTTYTKLHALLALHGGASAPPPISTADARGKKNLGFLTQSMVGAQPPAAKRGACAQRRGTQDESTVEATPGHALAM